MKKTLRSSSSSKLIWIVTKLLSVVVALLLSSPVVNATPISVPNASFESPASPVSTSTNVNVAPGWVFNVKGGSQYGTSAISSRFTLAGASSGDDFAIINNDWPAVTDTITSAASLGTIVPLTDYTLTVAIGNVKPSDSSLYGSPGNVSFSLLANGVAFATKTVTNGTVPNGTFENFTLTFTTPASGLIIGDNLKIQLATLPEEQFAYQAAFDNVNLQASHLAPVPVVPEPKALLLLVVGGLALFWLMRWRQT